MMWHSAIFCIFFRWNNCYLTIFLSETEGEDGDVHTLWQFTYDGVATIRCVLTENVTPFCSPGLLPEGGDGYL